MKIKVPLFFLPVKAKFVFFCVLGILLGVLLSLQMIPGALYPEFLQKPLEALYIQRKVILGFVLFFVVYCVWIYWEITFPLRKLLQAFQVAVNKKQVLFELDPPKRGDIYGRLVGKMCESMDMMKSYDTMKSSRIALEVQSVKMLMNQCSEGVLMINQNKVITHVNHQAEQLLGLIPGESAGELLSRFVAQEDLLKAIDRVFAEGEKIAGLSIVLLHEHPSSVSILPIKNKFGTLVRLMIVFKESKPEPVEEDKNNSGN